MFAHTTQTAKRYSSPKTPGAYHLIERVLQFRFLRIFTRLLQQQITILSQQLGALAGASAQLGDGVCVDELAARLIERCHETAVVVKSSKY